MKHPPRQYTDDEAYRMTEAFINETWGKKPDEMLDYRRWQREQAAAEG
jgi:myo-inositol-1-phosphate synthase